MTRLKLEIADFNAQLKKLIEEIYAEWINNRQQNKTYHKTRI
jgi:hypothetical protein